MDTKFHHCGETHCLGHSDLSIEEKPHSKKSHLHSVNQSPFGPALVNFHPLGCAQPTTTLHTPSISCQGMHSLSFTRKDRHMVSISPTTNHSKITSHMQPCLSQQFWPSIFHPDFWAQYNNHPAVTLECQSSDLEPWHAVTMHNPTTNQPWCYWLNF